MDPAAYRVALTPHARPLHVLRPLVISLVFLLPTVTPLLVRV